MQTIKSSNVVPNSQMQYNAFMIWIFIGLLALIVLFLIFRNGNVRFWKLAAKYPDRVYELVVEMSELNGTWMIDPDNKVTPEWIGPFQLYVPRLERVVVFYGKADVIENEQRRIELLLLAEGKS